MAQYTWSAADPYDVFYARYGKLPQMFLDVVLKYYRDKTILKQNPGDPYDEEKEYFYFKAKNKLNSLYGMTAQDPAKISIIFQDGVFSMKEETVADVLKKNYKKAFLSYAWGVWVTAWCRWTLQQGIDAAGDRFVYCDTDSVKTIGKVDMSEYNLLTKALSEANGGTAIDSTGRKHWLGLFENETVNGYDDFVTLGAKKYAYEDANGELHITVSGVGKKCGAAELKANGGLEAFQPGFVFHNSGKTESVYNDEKRPYITRIDGHLITITRNVVIRDTTYTLSTTDDYAELLNVSSNMLNKVHKFWLNCQLK
jgi:hypothetical protein